MCCVQVFMHVCVHVCACVCMCACVQAMLTPSLSASLAIDEAVILLIICCDGTYLFIQSPCRMCPGLRGSLGRAIARERPL